MAQAQVAHRLDRRARAHKPARLITEKMIENGGCSGLEHFHSAEQSAGIKIFFAHAAQRCAVVSAPDLQRLSRHHPAHQISRRVAVGIHQAGNRQAAAALDDAIEGTVGLPLRRTDINQAVGVDSNRSVVNHLVRRIHCRDQNVLNQRLHGFLVAKGHRRRSKGSEFRPFTVA